VGQGPLRPPGYAYDLDHVENHYARLTKLGCK